MELVGRSGCGKSGLVRMIAGRMVFHNYALYPHAVAVHPPLAEGTSQSFRLDSAALHFFDTASGQRR